MGCWTFRNRILLYSVVQEYSEEEGITMDSMDSSSILELGGCLIMESELL